ncbi:MAG: hypothetical protein IJ060_10920 [Oscillospiraceae bacterium]|nr:hypothetical protein [Oscillospiraceae bacterium]
MCEIPEALRRHFERKNARFAERHLGARQYTGNAGTISYPYTAYRESGWGAFLELFSILAFIAGAGAGFVMLSDAGHLWQVFAVLAALFIGKLLLSELARIVNNAHVRYKIRHHADYAEYFAFMYPAQEHLCRELNEIYAANPDADPELRVRLQMKLEERDDSRMKKVILILGLGFLILVLIAAVAGCIWVQHYLEE